MMRPGSIGLLENTRFHPGEEKNDPALVAALLDRFDADRPVRLLGVRMDLVPLDAETTADTDLDLEVT